MKKVKYLILFLSILPAQIFALTRVEEIENFFDKGLYDEAQNLINEVLNEKQPEENPVEKQPAENPSESPEVNTETVEDGNLIEVENSVEFENATELDVPREASVEEKSYALFYGALIKVQQGNFVEAESKFLQIVELNPEWEELDEVYWQLAKVNFLQKKYSTGLTFLNKISECKILSQELDNMIQHFFSEDIDDVELNRCVCLTPQNAFIARKWMFRQTQLSFADQYPWLIRYFLKKPEFKNWDRYFVTKVGIEKKEKYNVAIFLPLGLEKTPSKARYYDFYNLLMFVFENSPDSEKFQFYFYDTGKKSAALEETLQLEELKQMDIFINPSRKNLKTLSQFCLENQILLFDFSSKQLNDINENPFAFLTKASLESCSFGAAKFVYKEIKEEKKLKNVTVVALDTDIKIAEIFKNYLMLHKIPVNEVILKNDDSRDLLYKVRLNLKKIKKEQALKQKLEEKKREDEEEDEDTMEETEKLEVIKILEESDDIFVASNDLILLGNVIGITEQCKVSPKILCYYDVLNSNMCEELFNKKNITYITANQFNYNDTSFIEFKERFFDKTRKYPSLEMFYDYNTLLKILENISQQQLPLSHDVPTLNFVSF